MNLPDDVDYYAEPERCTNNWRTCPCEQCESEREDYAEKKYQRRRDEEFDNE